ncbi:MAG TPA: hypothetical protein VFU31_29800 [Candidatus Binatia bacterium]|nr:hypothetical protein [Candidatus Binatia bacterium]
MTVWNDEMKAAAMKDAQKVCDLTDVLREAREAISWHWETSSSIEQQNKDALLDMIDTMLGVAPGETQKNAEEVA